ncbi:MAG: NupC/NupG family nucleoside CNT transporter [Candidatus Riflebacteria bacterium]|nr:NupC/NupG family nucleoside CNT transporter [Candidatus Riflebacteria bacterium]
MEKFMSFIGIFVQIGICYAISTNRKKVDWKLVVMGFALQLGFALLILKTEAGQSFFQMMNGVIVTLLGFTQKGAGFVFGNLTGLNIPVGEAIIPAGSGIPAEMADLNCTGMVALYARPGAFFAFAVLPTIIFFSSFMAILYHAGIMQRVVYYVAWVMQKTMKTSGAESLSAAANIFVGQTEAPLVIRPYINKMTLSELNCIMVGGMATIAGGVMAAYVGMLRSKFPEIAGHLMAASVMSAPAAMVFAKIIVPEVEQPATAGQVTLNVEKVDQNLIDAAARGASEGLSLALNVAAMLIAFIALIELGNHAWGGICTYAMKIIPVNLAAIDSFQELLGYLNAPLAWMMGVPTKDLLVAGQILGEKTVINEFVAYAHLGKIINGEEILNGAKVVLDKRTWIIMTYACCGFANFGSIGIQLGGIGGLAPERRGELAKLGIRALIAGTFASYATANIAGMIVD